MVAIVMFLLALPAFPALSALSAAQPPLEQTLKNLSSRDRSTRLRAVQALEQQPNPEAAAPLARLVADPSDEIQVEAIAAELNIFLADKVVPRRRVGLLIEVRHPIDAEASFDAGPLAVGSLHVPPEVLTALRAAGRSDNPRIAVEGVYAFGTLGVEPAGAARRELLRTSGPDLAAMVGAAWRPLALAAIRVMGRVFAPRPGDDPIDPSSGDALISALNDTDQEIRAAAIDSLGAMRYPRAVQALTDLNSYFGKGAGAEATLDALARIASPASASLFEASLTSRTAAVRGIGIEGLARLGTRSALRDIQAATAGERNDGVLLAAAFASAMLGGAPLDPVVLALGHPKLKGQAQQYLVELAAGRAAQFGRSLQDPDPDVRAALLDALALGGDRTEIAIVQPLVTDRDPQVARAAARAAARLGAR
jgi:HEAT repeat protein